MSTRLLYALGSAILPLRVVGYSLAGVEALAHAGLVLATVHRDECELGAGYAIVHEITLMGHRHIAAFGPQRPPQHHSPGISTGPTSL
ncbi:MAG: hypothetical protein EOO27_01065 [Comamonadaceae bacterium]|nr:MAG: hypothetical protein EOO27_01065 [Comamonadaceae bacterium]